MRPSPELARQIVKEQPTDWKAWALLAATSPDPASARLAGTTMCSLLAKNPSIDASHVCGPDGAVHLDDLWRFRSESTCAKHP